jgi:hypothetical protein
VQHLRVTLQRRQDLREVLYRLVINELRKAGHFVDHARVELTDDGEGFPQLRADLFGRDTDLLFGRDHLQVGVSACVGQPLEVAFHHGTFKIRVLQELVEHDRIRLDAELHTLGVIRARRIRYRVLKCLPGIETHVRLVERFERFVHSRAGLQGPYGSVQSRRELAHMPKPVPTLAALEVLQA